MSQRGGRGWQRLLSGALLPLLALMSACEQRAVATEVLVLIDAEAATAAALVRLEVDVYDGRSLDSAKKRLNIPLGSGTGEHHLPLSFSIAALDQDDEREFRVLVTGFDATQTPRVEQQVITSFHPNSAGRLDLYLYAGCSDLCRVDGVPGELTCSRAGVCEAVPVRTELPTASGDELGGYTSVVPVPIMSDGGEDPADDDGGLAGGGGQDAATGSVEAGQSPPADTGPSPGSDTGSSPGSDTGPSPGSDAGDGDGGGDALSDARVDATAGSVDSSTPPDASADAQMDLDGAADAAEYAFDPIIPAPSGACPSFQSGSLTVMGLSTTIYAGPIGNKKGALLFYWHGTGGAASEATKMLPEAVRAEIMEGGGMIVSGGTSTGMGDDTTGAQVWRTGDLPPMDQIAACAVRDYNIDPRRIYSTGCSLGGTHASYMAFSRASYMAAVTTNSGGLMDELGVGVLQPGAPRMTPVLTMHGGPSDQVVVNFSEASKRLYTQAKAQGGIAIDCEHGGNHCGASAELQTAAWQFMKDHPYGVQPRPYPSALPASFPSYCTIK